MNKGAAGKAGWKSMKLRDVCRLINGPAYSRPAFLTVGKYRFPS